jgi:antitoxin ParD1/3/4
MNVSLTPELEQYIQAKVQSGFYHSSSEVIREALRLLKERDILQADKLETLRQEVLRGVAQADEGTFSTRTSADLKAEGRRRLSQA